MALYVLSDTHLSIGVNKPMDIFGYRWNGHFEKMKNAWCNTVKKEDTVVIPGDISWGMNFEEAREDLLFLDSLPGTKIISKGNHDYWWATKAKADAFFEQEGITTIKLLHNNAYRAEGFVVCGSRGWYTDDHNSPGNAEDYNKIVNREVGRINLSLDYADKMGFEGERLMFLHFPPVYGDYICDEIVNALEARGVKKCFYGHIHGVYDMPQTIVYKGIEFTIISADYLNFVPYKVLN